MIIWRQSAFYVRSASQHYAEDIIVASAAKCFARSTSCLFLCFRNLNLNFVDPVNGAPVDALKAPLSSILVLLDVVIRASPFYRFNDTFIKANSNTFFDIILLIR